MAIPNPFSSSAPGAAAKKAALVKIGEKAQQKELAATKKGYAKGREALAPTLTNIGDIYAQEQLGRGDYLGALGVGTPEQQAAAKTAYGNYLAPVNEYGIQDLERYGANTGTLASGGTQKDLYDYGYTTRFAPWLQQLSQFNPLAANAQYGTLAGKLSDLAVGQGSALTGIYGNTAANQANAVGGYYDALAGARQNAAGNLLSAGIAGVNTLGNVAGMAMNPAGSLASKLPQYASNVPATPTSYGGTFPGFGFG